MTVKFTHTSKDALDGFFQRYLQSLSSPIEPFLEDHIVESDFFSIDWQGTPIGYTAIHQKALITQFFLDKAYQALGQSIFFQVKKLAEVQRAFVPTCDEFFLSHALEANQRVEMQAYFFQDGQSPTTSPKAKNGFQLTLATSGDIALIREKTEDFFDPLEKRIADHQIYIGSYNDEIVSFGILEKSKFLEPYAGIGMFVLAEQRQKGFGADTLLQLKQEVYQMEKSPVAGCWYYNHNSKKTLEKAGMCTKTRLLNIHF